MIAIENQANIAKMNELESWKRKKCIVKKKTSANHASQADRF